MYIAMTYELCGSQVALLKPFTEVHQIYCGIL